MTLLFKVIRPRYVDAGPHVLPALQGLLTDHQAFVDACYYETTRADDLLAAFAEGPLWCWWREGRLAIDVDDALVWLRQLAVQGEVPVWTDSVQTRTAQGLLSTLRDFGILKGVLRGQKKEIASPSLSPRGFAYVAWREHEHRVPRPVRWPPVQSGVVGFLTTIMFEDLFMQAARSGVLRVSRAGSAVRIDWLVGSLAEVTSAAA